MILPQQQTSLRAQQELALLRSLQTTIDYKTLIYIFVSHIKEHLDIKGFAYEDEANDVHLKSGTTGHSVSYEINIFKQNLTKIFFYRDYAFSAQDLDLIEDLLALVVHPLHNSLQYLRAIELSLTDPLTKTGNRLAMTNNLNRELDFLRRYGGKLSVALIDIDDFKVINDNFGHLAGDKVLKDIALSLSSIIRNTDLIFRFGGEEFLVILSKTDLEGAKVFAKRALELVQNLISFHNNHNINCTISLGLTDATIGDDVNSIIKRADKALYMAKTSGKNRACCG